MPALIHLFYLAYAAVIVGLLGLLRVVVANSYFMGAAAATS